MGRLIERKIADELRRLVSNSDSGKKRCIPAFQCIANIQAAYGDIPFQIARAQLSLPSDEQGRTEVLP